MARVVLQMGHCFRRTGATGTNGRDGDPNEQEFAQACCYAAASHLRTAGHSPLVIDADEPDSSYAGDAFVAVHCDGSISGDARGASVGYRTSQGAHLGAEFKSAYAKAGWVGWRPDNYTAALAGYYGTAAAVRAGNRYALIVEAGFLTSHHDEPLLSLPDGPDRAARAITAAVVAVFGGATPQPPQPPPEEDDDMHKPYILVHPAGPHFYICGPLVVYLTNGATRVNYKDGNFDSVTVQDATDADAIIAAHRSLAAQP